MNRRICTEVIIQMMEHIPENKTEFIKDLQWNYEDASYKAPEETPQWIRTSQTLQKHITKPTEEWEFNVLSIFSTKTVDEIKEFFKN